VADALFLDQRSVPGYFAIEEVDLGCQIRSALFGRLSRTRGVGLEEGSILCDLPIKEFDLE